MLIIGGFFINFKRQREQKQVNSLFYRKKKSSSTRLYRWNIILQKKMPLKWSNNAAFASLKTHEKINASIMSKSLYMSNYILSLWAQNMFIACVGIELWLK